MKKRQKSFEKTPTKWFNDRSIVTLDKAVKILADLLGLITCNATLLCAPAALPQLHRVRNEKYTMKDGQHGRTI